tara:strand:- start:1656 stop:1844 length:189 start_codon:yes stop_codon:yes gene_type:complete
MYPQPEIMRLMTVFGYSNSKTEPSKNTEKKEGSLRHGTGAYIPDFANLTMLCPMLFGRGCIR